MDIQLISERLSKIDGRPYHPEDYLKVAKNINKHMGLFESTINGRLSFLEMNGDLYSDIISADDFVITGILRDGYTGKILYQDKGE
jgi:hypothetical protein